MYYESSLQNLFSCLIFIAFWFALKWSLLNVNDHFESVWGFGIPLETKNYYLGVIYFKNRTQWWLDFSFIFSSVLNYTILHFWCLIFCLRCHKFCAFAIFITRANSPRWNSNFLVLNVVFSNPLLCLRG